MKQHHYSLKLMSLCATLFLALTSFAGASSMAPGRDGKSPEATAKSCTNTFATQTTSSCSPYVWPIDGLTYTTSGMYTGTIPNAEGCDSIITLDLTILSNTGTDVQAVCGPYTWIDGNTYATSNNTATFTLTNVAGCDSVVTLDLTILSNTGTDVQAACGPYTWMDGNTYTTSNNTATFTLTNTAGCDSVVTLDLTILSNTGTDLQVACDSYTWIDGNTYMASNNTATFTLTNAAGCDSIVTLDLTVNYTTTGTDVQTACDSYTWIDGNTYTTSNNTATFTLTNAAGCDSLVTLDLTINYSTTGTDVQTACGPFTWIDGNTYLVSNNTATFTLTNAAGCDSIVTLDLTSSNTTGTDVQSDCGPYTWIDGNTYTTSNNTATFTLPNAAGCDSIVTLDLTILTTTGTDVQTACDSYTWMDGNTYTTSNNTATFTLTNAAGCDSIVTLDLTILSNTGTDVQAACDSYTWIDGNTYTTSNNTATFTLTNAAGCDSVVTLDLTINYPTTGTDVQTACDSYTWIDGNTYVASNNTATFVLTNAAGCDSLVTLDLTVNYSTSGTDVQVACDSYTWIDGNTYVSTTNTPTFTLTNAAGCDSIVTLDLTVNYSTTGTDVQSACDSYTWIDGNTYTASNNTATFTLTNAAGCDSTVTLDLTVNYSTSGTDVQTACGPFTWIDGNVYTASNSTATFTLTNAAGCDSIVTLNLTSSNTTGTDVQSACAPFTWIDGNVYTTSNSTATFILPNAAGCDSLVTLNLTILNTAGTDIQTACSPFTWIDGNIYTASNNTATFTLTNAAGCDSLVTLDLIILNTAGTDVQTACGSYTWIDGNIYTASNNTATFTLTNAAGCDSLVTLDLTINNATTGTDVQTACGSYTWIDGNTYTASNNTAMFTLTNAAGCDSIVTLDLTINNATTGTDVQTACGSFTWIDGNTYTTSNNTATFTLTNAAGCDSIVTLDLTMGSSSGTDVQTACGPFTWIDGNTYTTSNNTATFTLTGAGGCDSIVTLDLTIGQPSTGVDVKSACSSYTWINGVTYTASTNTPTFTLTNAEGCDSIVTLNLTIGLTVGISDNGAGILTATGGTSYLWYNCVTDTLVPFEGTSTYLPATNGTYAAIVSNGSCTDTTDCVVVDYIGLTEKQDLSVAIYPNPSTDFVTVTFAGQSAVLEIRDAQGKLVGTNAIQSNSAVSLNELEAGVYFFTLTTGEYRTTQRVVKQ